MVLLLASAPPFMVSTTETGASWKRIPTSGGAIVEEASKLEADAVWGRVSDS